jgi:hypothetical protein
MGCYFLDSKKPESLILKIRHKIHSTLKILFLVKLGLRNDCKNFFNKMNTF